MHCPVKKKEKKRIGLVVNAVFPLFELLHPYVQIALISGVIAIHILQYSGKPPVTKAIFKEYLRDGFDHGGNVSLVMETTLRSNFK